MKTKLQILPCALTSVCLGVMPLMVSQTAMAGPSAEEAAELGRSLTPVGAKKAGNAEGTIPEWAGGITEPPEDYSRGGEYVDPYEDDEPLFVITGQNWREHSDYLTKGQMAMLQTYKDSYRIPVYPTRRSASFPDYIYDATARNATSASLANDGNSLKGAIQGVPFPIPENGAQVIWNHKTRFRGEGIKRHNVQALVNQDGSHQLIAMLEKLSFNYSLHDAKVSDLDNVLLYFEQSIERPRRMEGITLKVFDTLDPATEPRMAWEYNPGSKRLRRLPDFGYDNPGTASEGMRTTDQFDVFNGSLDRHLWQLMGKREIYIPYNAYRLDDYDLDYDDIIQAGHVNPDYTRHELHRVWVVDAHLKDDMRHLYKRRTFYVDEDTWQIVLVDVYDKRDEMWQVQVAHPFNAYDIKGVLNAVEAVYDLKTRKYLLMSMDNEEEVVDTEFYVGQ